MITEYFQAGPFFAYAAMVVIIAIRHRGSLLSLATAERIAQTAFTASIAVSLGMSVHTLLYLTGWEQLLGPRLGFILLLPFYASIVYTALLLLGSRKQPDYDQNQ